MFDSRFWAFMGLAALVTISPGADTVLTIRNTLVGGTREGSLLMAGCDYLMGALWLSGIALVTGKSRVLLTRTRIKATLETVSGCAMIGFGARLAFARAR